MIYIYCLLFYEARKCELETKSALRKPTRKGTDARYNFSSVHLRRRKHMTTKTANDTSIGNESGRSVFNLKVALFDPHHFVF